MTVTIFYDDDATDDKQTIAFDTEREASYFITGLLARETAQFDHIEYDDHPVEDQWSPPPRAFEDEGTNEKRPHWDVEKTDSNENPIAWKNIHTDLVIGIREQEYGEGWEVAGENSRIDTAESKEEAREIAHAFMDECSHPSAMV